jgi:hypothetical protein
VISAFASRPGELTATATVAMQRLALSGRSSVTALPPGGEPHAPRPFIDGAHRAEDHLRHYVPRLTAATIHVRPH